MINIQNISSYFVPKTWARAAALACATAAGAYFLQQQFFPSSKVESEKRQETPPRFSVLIPGEDERRIVTVQGVAGRMIQVQFQDNPKWTHWVQRAVWLSWKAEQLW